MKGVVCDSFESRTGRGIVVTRGNKTFWAGSHRLLKDFGAIISLDDALNNCGNKYKFVIEFLEE